MYEGRRIEAPEVDLDHLFTPRSVAHVGASPKAVPGRYNYTDYMIRMNFEGDIYPINPNYAEVFGLPCYASLKDVPGEIDLAILAIPARMCVDALEDVPVGKIKFVIIHTSGFGEIDNSDLEERVLQLAREKGFRVIGPNCMGIYSQPGRIGFWEEHWETVKYTGSVGIISQSGGHCVNLILSGMDAGVGIHKVLSLGNQLDLSINEALEYMGRDDGVGVIITYIEDIRDGKRFLELLKEIVPKKPVLVWKGGQTEVGKAAVESHTGSLAGNERIFESAMRQVGAIMVNEFWEVLRVARLLQPPFPLSGGNLAILSPGGGNTVSLSDLFSSQPNLTLPRLAPETHSKLRELLPEENVDIGNPIDPGAVGYSKLRELIETVGADPAIDAVVVSFRVDYLCYIEQMEDRFKEAKRICEIYRESAQKIGMPVYIMMRQQRQNHEDLDFCRRIMVEMLVKMKIPWVDGSFRDAAETFEKLVGYRNYINGII